MRLSSIYQWNYFKNEQLTIDHKKNELFKSDVKHGKPFSLFTTHIHTYILPHHIELLPSLPS
jgi:hypothetical protein